jgi:hypothetical protein
MNGPVDPQRLKARVVIRSGGTAEAVPFPNLPGDESVRKVGPVHELNLPENSALHELEVEWFTEMPCGATDGAVGLGILRSSPLRMTEL